MNRDEKRVFEEESTDAGLEEHVNEGAVSDIVKSPLNYVGAFADPASGAFALEPTLENSITLPARDWANPSTRLDLSLTELFGASDAITVNRAGVLQPGFLGPVVPSFETDPTILLTQDFHLPPTAEDLAKKVEKLSEEDMR